MPMVQPIAKPASKAVIYKIMKAKKGKGLFIFSKETSNYSIAKRALLFGILFGVSAMGTMAFIKSRKSKGSIQPTISVPADDGKNQFPFVNPTAATEQVREVRPFKSTIENLVQRMKTQGKASSISVYFRSMRNGYAFGVNPHEKYYPASLLKVPMMMAYMKAGMDNIGLLVKKVKFAKPFVGMPSNNIPDKLEVGKEYTISELMVRMLINSDNDATLLLHQNIDPKFYTKTLKELELNVPEMVSGDDNYLSVIDYSRIWRILYNASYLNRNNSNYALFLLTKAIFAEGIPTGTPGKTVAHKFGEWASNGTIQLHDCGVVYDGDDTYMLSIMTKGKNRATLASVIADISKAVQGSVHEMVPVPVP